MNVNNYGFILTRHVNSEKTNKYWNRAVRCIRKFYPLKKIVIIDDNSDQNFVKAELEYANVIIVHSEFPGRGELLPYYYFYKNRFFNNAVIIHDSVFFHKKINFDAVKHFALPMWHFNPDEENVDNSVRLISYLKNNYELTQNLFIRNNKVVMGFKNKWSGCFGGQSYINYEFLVALQNKYDLFNLLYCVRNRSDRCCLERILGVMFSINQRSLNKEKSLLGNIATYSKWGYTFDEYCDFLDKNKSSPLAVVKVWTGR